MRFRPIPGGAVGAWLLLVPLVAMAVAVVVTSLGDPGTPGWFTAGFPVVLVGGAGLLLVRAAVELTIVGDSILVVTPIGRRLVPIDRLARVRPARGLANVVVIEVVGDRAIVVAGVKGIRRFLDEVARRHPGLPVQLGLQTRIAERLPGRSRTSEAD